MTEEGIRVWEKSLKVSITRVKCLKNNDALPCSGKLRKKMRREVYAD